MEKIEFTEPELKEINFDELVQMILNMEIMNGKEVNFTEDAKKLIHVAAEKAKKAAVYKHNADKQSERWKAAPAEELFTEMLLKIVNAPTKIHMMAAPRLMIPAVDEAIRRQQA